jgi:predicted HNH restriction endonuclease
LKVVALANRGLSIERIDEEIAKCVILCANCHRKLHAGRFELE